MSSGSGSGGSGVGGTRRSATQQKASSNTSCVQPINFFYTMYDFEATDKAVMLTLKKGQVVRFLPEAYSESSGDWCYVEDRAGNKGYVPRLYLKSYGKI